MREALREVIGATLRAPARDARHAVGAGSASRTVEVDGVRLAYDDHGSGSAEPIVLLHATGHGSREFEELRAHLVGERRVIALDWPGHGRSGDDGRAASVARYAELLGGFLGALGLDRVVLLGNSIGGGAALRFAATHPERVRALVLENPAGLTAVDPVATRFVRGMSRFFEAGARGAPWFPAAFAAYYRTVLPRDTTGAHRRRIVDAGPASAQVLAQAWYSFGERDADLRELARALTVPTLVVWAVRDRLNTLRRARPAIRALANARLVTVDAGHCPHIETLDELATTLRQFLSELPPIS